MPNAFDVDQLRLQIEALIRELPELQEDETVRADMLEGLTEMPEVLMALVRAEKRTKGWVKVLGGEIDDIKERRARYTARIEVLRGLMLQILQSADLKRVELPIATISQRNGQPQIVGEPDVDTLPPDLLNVTIEPNRTAIREALMNGQDLPGLFLTNSAPSLAINVK
jgi:hypothetical protein